MQRRDSAATNAVSVFSRKKSYNDFFYQSRPQSNHNAAKPRNKKAAPPTIAQSLRDKEKKMQEEYYASLKTANLDLP